MAEVTDHMRACALGVVLARAEALLSLPADPSVVIKERCEQILVAARHGALDVRAYRLAYWIERGRA
jgi:hypothetical protein